MIGFFQFFHFLQFHEILLNLIVAFAKKINFYILLYKRTVTCAQLLGQSEHTIHIYWWNGLACICSCILVGRKSQFGIRLALSLPGCHFLNIFDTKVSSKNKSRVSQFFGQSVTNDTSTPVLEPQLYNAGS